MKCKGCGEEIIGQPVGFNFCSRLCWEDYYGEDLNELEHEDDLREEEEAGEYDE